MQARDFEFRPLPPPAFSLEPQSGEATFRVVHFPVPRSWEDTEGAAYRVGRLLVRLFRLFSQRQGWLEKGADQGRRIAKAVKRGAEDEWAESTV